MTLKKGIITSQRSMRQQKVRFQGRRNPIEAKLAKNKLFTRAVNKPAEWREIHGMIKKIAEGGVYKNEMRELSDKLAHGHEAQTIDHKEGRLIAEAIHEEFLPELKKYKSSRSDSSKNSSYRATGPNSESKNTDTGRQSSFIRSRPGKVSAQTTSSPTKGVASFTPVQMATFRNKIRNLSEGESGGQEEGRFSRALRFVKKR